MLWADFDVDMVTNGIDGFAMALLKLPRELQGLPPYECINTNLETFKESLPLPGSHALQAA